MTTTTVSKFNGVSTAVMKFITEKTPDNVVNSTVETAIQLHIAIQNAENIFRDCLPDQQPLLDEKVKEFETMMACLEKTDYCHLNLLPRIRQSIDSGTSDGWLPKYYGVNPQHIVPEAGSPVDIFGKFKYADPSYKARYQPSLEAEKDTFFPIKANQFTLTYVPTLGGEENPFQDDKCSLFLTKLKVPYESGNISLVISQPKTFEFTVLIRALPRNAGRLDLQNVDGALSAVSHTMKWGITSTVELDSAHVSQLTFTSFDGKKQEFQVAKLEEDAKQSLPALFTLNATYLKISQISAEKHQWAIETVPPINL